jgi:hypothetical protein
MLTGMRRAALLALPGFFLTSFARGADVINTDRPSFSNSTVIVATGTLQLETGVNRQETQDTLGTKTWLTQTPVLFRAGVWKNFEGRLNWNGYEWHDAGPDHSEGAGDLSAGFKWRHRAQDGCTPAIASVLMVAFPSGSASVRTLGVRPGWQLPMDWVFPGDNVLTVMPATTYDTSAERRRYWSGAFSALVSHSWTPRIQTFLEYAGQQFAFPEDGGVVETADIGGGWAFLPDWQIDGAVYLGLNRNSPVEFFTMGLSTHWK